MSHELETAAAGSFGGFFRWRRKVGHAVPIGTPCANCATPLQGPWCYQCGQLGEDFHRSVGHLVIEAFEGLFHFDGRVWQTVPDLMRRPGRLTRTYLDGHRAPQIPPLRLFLVVLLALFLAGSISGGPKLNTTTTDDHGKVLSSKVRQLDQLTPDERAKVKAQVAKPDSTRIEFGGKRNAVLEGWVRGRVTKAMDDPERFTMAMEQWSERFAFLMLPLAAGLLSLLFVFQRRFFVFDHTIFALHSLSAAGLILTAWLLTRITIGGWAQLLWWGLPVHLFAHMRGVYQTSILGTLIRMFLLFIGSMFGFAVIMVGLVATALNTLG